MGDDLGFQFDGRDKGRMYHLIENLCTYQCKPRGGGGECGQGVGIWQILTFLDQIPQGGKRKVDQNWKKAPTAGKKNLKKQYYNTI